MAWERGQEKHVWQKKAKIFSEKLDGLPHIHAGPCAKYHRKRACMVTLKLNNGQHYCMSLVSSFDYGQTNHLQCAYVNYRSRELYDSRYHIVGNLVGIKFGNFGQNAKFQNLANFKYGNSVPRLKNDITTTRKVSSSLSWAIFSTIPSHLHHLLQCVLFVLQGKTTLTWSMQDCGLLRPEHASFSRQ